MAAVRPSGSGRSTGVQNVPVGTWGPGLYSDDLARDVRGDYRRLLEDGTADEEATSRVLAQYLAEPADPDDDAVVWLALAVTQSTIGRLDPMVQARALEVIDDGVGQDRWADDPKLLAKRRAALAKVRAQLVGPQPARKALRPPRRHVTTLQAGDVLAYRGSNDQLALFRVARIDDSRTAVAPILVTLDFIGDQTPEPAVLDTLPDRIEPQRRFDGLPWSTTQFYVQVMRRIDHEAAGFRRIGTAARRAGDNTVFARSYTDWHAMARYIEHELTGQWTSDHDSVADP